MAASVDFQIPPASAKAFEVNKGHTITVIDLEGQQVADFVCFNRNDLAERLSTSRTRSENGTIRISTGHYLFSNRNNKLFTITKDTCGVHDLLYPPCSRWVFEHRYRIKPHDGCLENLTNALKEWNLSPEELPDPFNIFENSVVSQEGRIRIEDPLSRASDYVEMRAEMDCLVAVSACAVDVGHTNAGHCKPIGIRVR